MEPYLTIQEVARILKLSVQTVRRYVMKRGNTLSQDFQGGAL
jgi:DNA-binding transcriptional MerR regulator